MKYRVTIDDQEREISVHVRPNGQFDVTLNGERVDVDVQQVPGGLCLNIDGKIYDLAIGSQDETLEVGNHQAVHTVEAISERQRSRKSRKALGSSENELRAPMPGRIVRIQAESGQAIGKGVPCIVIEAMKMENELKAPRDGIVDEIHVSEGESVEAKTLLISFKEA